MLFIYNDLHIGVNRTAGTTVESQERLRNWLLAGFHMLLEQATGHDVMILGDLFDTDKIPGRDLYLTYSGLTRFLDNNPNSWLYLVAGNHDLSKDNSKLSSFELLARLLTHNYKNVVVIQAPMLTPYGYVIPHLANQDLFDQALASMPKVHTLFLHCNYDNHFAVESDQSLNLSADQAEKLPCDQIIIAHEHQMRMIGTKILIPGNQAPSSVSDCLRTDGKYFITIEENGEGTLHKLSSIDETLARMDWRNLQSSSLEFIRIEGTAEAEEAAEVVSAISRYRASSSALVVSNAVEIRSQDGTDTFAQSLESVKAFDVLAALKEMLTEQEYAVVEKVLQ